MPDVQVDMMMHQLGFEGFDRISPDDIRLHLLAHSAIVAFSDGDIEMLHESLDDPWQRRNFGNQNYRDGLVTVALADAALYHDPNDAGAEIYKFQELIADVVDKSRALGLPIGTGQSVVQINADSIEVDNRFIVPLKTFPKNVLELGACISSRSHVDDQLRLRGESDNFFQYIAVARNHFVNRMIMNKYLERLGFANANNLIGAQLYIGREDGSAEATSEMLRMQRERGSTNVFDVVLCANPNQHMSRRDILETFPRLKDMLSAGGKLIVRAVEKPTEQEFGIKELSELAQDNGLKIGSSLGYQSTGHTDYANDLGGNKPSHRTFRSVAFELK